MSAQQKERYNDRCGGLCRYFDDSAMQTHGGGGDWKQRRAGELKWSREPRDDVIANDRPDRGTRGRRDSDRKITARRQRTHAKICTLEQKITNNRIAYTEKKIPKD